MSRSGKGVASVAVLVVLTLLAVNGAGAAPGTRSATSTTTTLPPSTTTTSTTSTTTTVPPPPPPPPTTAPSTTTTSTPSTTSTTTTEAPAPPPTDPPASWADVLARIATYAGTRSGDIEVAITDLSSGEVLDLGDDDPIRAASIIKVAIAVTVLRQDEAAGQTPSDDEMATMTAMIEESDNDAAQTLWDQIGGADGLQPTLDAVGMGATVADDDAWGFTTTTAADQTKLLVALDRGQLLSADDTQTLLGLMRNVDPGQRFGPAQAAPDLDPAVKNGWYPDTDAPTWRINCLAIFDGGVTHPFAISVLTRYDQSLGESYGAQTAADVAAIALGYAR